MREIDFTPDWYAATRREREASPFHAGGLIIIGVLIAAWSYGATSRTRAAETELATLRASLGAQKGVTAQVQTMEAELAARQRCAELLAEVGGGVRTAPLIAELSHLLPPAVGMRSLRLVRAPRVAPATETEKDAPAPRTGEGAPVRTSLQLDGWSASGADVGALLQRLAASPLFEDVVLRYQRTTIVAQNTIVEFQIVGTMPEFE